MKKTIYGVMCKTRIRGSEEPWSEPYIIYCTSTKQEAEDDCKKFNQEDDFKKRFLQEKYYCEEISLYSKD